MCTSLKRRKEFPVQLETALNPSDRDVTGKHLDFAECSLETLALAILTGYLVPLPARLPHGVQIVSSAMRFSSNRNFPIQVNTCILRFLHLKSMNWRHIALMTWNFLACCSFKYQDLNYSSFLPNPMSFLCHWWCLKSRMSLETCMCAVYWGVLSETPVKNRGSRTR